MSNLRYALRWLRRSPGFAAVAILSLGLGIGVNTAMFSLVDAVLLRPLPVEDPSSLADVFTSSSDGDEYATDVVPRLPRCEVAEHRLQRHAGLHADVRAAEPGRSGAVVIGQLVTSNHFEMLGVRPAIGRMLQPADDAPGAERVVVIAHQMWQSDFGGDRASSDARAAARAAVHDRRCRARQLYRPGAADRAGALAADHARRGSRACRHQRQHSVATDARGSNGAAADRSSSRAG